MSSFATIIPLRCRVESTRHVFFIHGVSGDLPDIAPIVRQIPSEFNIYAIRSQALDPETPPLTSMAEIADYQLHQVKQCARNGQYWFVGFSFGGMLAFEMVKQLKAKGMDQCFLAMIDTVDMSYVARMEKAESTKTRIRQIVIQIRTRFREGITSGNFLIYSVSKLKHRAIRLLYCFSQHRGGPIPKAFGSAFDINWFAAVNYIPTALDGSITLFKSTNQAWDQRVPSHLGWKDLALGGLREIQIPGDHVTLMAEPGIRQLTAHLCEFLRDGTAKTIIPLSRW